MISYYNACYINPNKSNRKCTTIIFALGNCHKVWFCENKMVKSKDCEEDGFSGSDGKHFILKQGFFIKILMGNYWEHNLPNF